MMFYAIQTIYFLKAYHLVNIKPCLYHCIIVSLYHGGKPAWRRRQLEQPPTRRLLPWRLLWERHQVWWNQCICWHQLLQVVMNTKAWSPACPASNVSSCGTKLDHLRSTSGCNNWGRFAVTDGAAGREKMFSPQSPPCSWSSSAQRSPCWCPPGCSQAAMKWAFCQNTTI